MREVKYARGTLSGLRGRDYRHPDHPRPDRDAAHQPGPVGRKTQCAAAGGGRGAGGSDRHHPVHVRAGSAFGRLGGAFYRREVDRRGLSGLARRQDDPRKGRRGRRRSAGRQKGPLRPGLLRHGLKPEKHHVFHRVPAAVRVAWASRAAATGAHGGDVHRAGGGQCLPVCGACRQRGQPPDPAGRCRRHPQGRRRGACWSRGVDGGDEKGGVNTISVPSVYVGSLLREK